MSNVRFQLKFSHMDETEIWNQISRVIEPEQEKYMHDLMETIKRRIAFNIETGRKSTAPSPVGYRPGSLARSTRYRIRKYKRVDGTTSVRGYLSVGEGLPYARVHDNPGSTLITGNMTFFSHTPSAKNPKGRWVVNIKSVNRPGRPYFDNAVAYGLAKFGITE